MLPLRFFRNRTFAAASLASLLMYTAAFGALFLIAQLLQTGLGAGPVQAGLRTLPLAVMPVILAPIGGALCDRFGNRPLMIAALSLEAVAFAWLAIATRPGVAYPVLLPAMVLMGAGLPLFWAPIASASLGAARPHEQGQASGASIAIRELAIVLGVAILASSFAAHGSYASPTSFIAGFIPAMWLAAALTATGALVAFTLPRHRPTVEPAAPGRPGRTHPSGVTRGRPRDGSARPKATRLRP